MLLGCIADDFTGATDLANTLTRRRMRTILMIGVSKAVSPEAHPIVAIVVALKSRTIPADQAVALSLSACRWLMRDGARQRPTLVRYLAPIKGSVCGTA
jgi:3-dehydrotetronate 4-kinase